LATFSVNPHYQISSESIK